MASPVDVLNSAFAEAGVKAALGVDAGGVCSYDPVLDAKKVTAKKSQILKVWEQHQLGVKPAKIAGAEGLPFTEEQVKWIITKIKTQVPQMVKVLGADNPLVAAAINPAAKIPGVTKAIPIPTVKVPPPPPAPPIGIPPVVSKNVAVPKTTEFFDELLKNNIAPAKGSNPGGVFKLGEEKFYVKFYADPAQGRGEHLANTMYRELNLRAPESFVGKTSEGKHVYASRWMDDLYGTGQSVGMSEESAQKFMDGFVADVLTGNWDAAGTGLDNVGIFKDGSVARLDQGGTFLFRAKAGRKPGSALNEISEWTKFFDGSNPYYKQVANMAGVFEAEDLTEARLIKQIDQVKTLVGNPEFISNWKSYVAARMPEDTPTDEIQAIASMLRSRIGHLDVKRTELYSALTAPKTVAKAYASGQWPVDDSTPRSMGAKYPQEVEKVYRSWVNTLTPEQRNVIDDYTGSGYQQMNALLQKRLPSGYMGEQGVARLNAQVERLSKALDKAIEHHTPPPPELVWRGLKEGVYTQKFRTAATGDTLTLDGFQSTSVDPEFAQRWATSGVMLEIKPSAGAYIKPISGLPHEMEFLLPHGKSYRVVGQTKIKIIGKGGRKITQTVLQLEMQ